MNLNIIEIKNLKAERSDKTVFQNLNWTLRPQDNWAIIGKMSMGKTSFIDLIMGKMTVKEGSISYPALSDKAMKSKGYFRLAEYVAVVRFNISLINYKQFYYQQRYYSTENDEVKTVRDFLKTIDENIFNLLKINELLDLEINKLSNGQTRKMYLAKALLKKPQLLILDNPFLGLDTEARDILKNIINDLITEGYQIIVICNYPSDIPSRITHYLLMDNFKATEIHTDALKHYQNAWDTEGGTPYGDIPLIPSPPPQLYNNVVKMDNVTVQYDDTIVLKNIYWQVQKNEKWALVGANGSGKSTLLSLIFGDHPQAYSNEVIVFDKKRGNGDSIWDIKNRIGFVSPELHLYFTEHISNFMLVTEGVAERAAFAHQLFEFYNLTAIKRQNFQESSTGEQRLILLLKALAQNPELLILDEPFQGMDKNTIEKTQYLINEFSKNRTLIIVTHYTTEIPQCVNKILKLEKGEVK